MVAAMYEHHPIETAPRDRDVLLWFDYPGQRRWVYGRYRDTVLWGPCWEYDGEYTVCLKDNVITRWMDLPPPVPGATVQEG